MNSIETFLKENAHVHIHENKRVQVEQTLRALINDGRRLLHVVADFDFTLTMYDKDSVSLPSTFGVIEMNDRVKVLQPSSTSSIGCLEQSIVLLSRSHSMFTKPMPHRMLPIQEL